MPAVKLSLAMAADWGALLFVAVLGIVASGCPANTEDPPRPSGTPCATVADCNAGQVCGRLVACVDLRCENGQSLEIPCPAAR